MAGGEREINCPCCGERVIDISNATSRGGRTHYCSRKVSMWTYKVGDRVRIHITHEESALEGAEGVVTRRMKYEGGELGYDVRMDGDAISHPFDESELVPVG